MKRPVDYVQNRDDTFEEIDNAIKGVLADDIHLLDENIPPIVLFHKNGQDWFRLKDLEFSLDWTQLDGLGLSRLKSRLDNYAAHGHDLHGKHVARTITIRQAIRVRETEIVKEYGKNRAEKDIKPQYLNKLIQNDEALVLLNQNLTQYEAVLAMMEGRLKNYEQRIASLSREIEIRKTK